MRIPATSLLLALPLASAAQALPPLFSRLYTGVGIHLNPYSDNKNLLPEATLGYQLRPRLAVQASATYPTHSLGGDQLHSGALYSYTGAGGATIYGPAGQQFFVWRLATAGWSASVAARYTLTRQPQRHLQVDVLGGLLLDHLRRSYEDITLLDSTRAVIASNEWHTTTTSSWLRLGPSLRAELGRHFELALDISALKSLNYFTRWGVAGSVGLRYRWHYRYQH